MAESWASLRGVVPGDLDFRQLRHLLVENHKLGSFQALDIIRGVCAAVRFNIESGHDFLLRGFGTWRSACGREPTYNTIRFKASSALLQRLGAAVESD